MGATSSGPSSRPGHAATLIAALRLGAENLQKRAELIGGTDELHFWQRRRDEWVRESSQLIERHVGHGTATSFRRLAYDARTATDWRHELANDLGSLREAIQLIDQLASVA